MANESSAASMPNISSLLGALQAVKNVRAVILTALVLVSTALVFGLVLFVAGQTGSAALTLIGTLFAYLVGIYGISAVGFMLMNDAKGAAPLSMADALMVSLMSTHRWIAVMLLALVVFIVFAIVLAALLFICKIPVAGPVLYAVVVPVATFTTAMFLAAMYFVVMPLAFPSVWSGDSAMQVVSKLTAIAHQRLVQVVVQVVLLMLLCFFVAGIIASLVFSASAVVGALSAGILPGVGSGLGGLGGLGGMGGMGRMMGGAGGGGYLIAGGIGFAIVFAVVLIVPFLMMVQGYCLIYLDVIKGIDFSASEEALKGQMENLQRKAREAQERVREKTQAQPVAPAAAPPAPTAVAPPPPAPAIAPASTCPKCNFAITSADVFCGGCGHKLR